MMDIQHLARGERLTVGEWVRRILREACEQKSLHDPDTKLKAVRCGAEWSFPTADIDEMLREIEGR
jgi:hypothetical protein